MRIVLAAAAVLASCVPAVAGRGHYHPQAPRGHYNNHYHGGGHMHYRYSLPGMYHKYEYRGYYPNVYPIPVPPPQYYAPAPVYAPPPPAYVPVPEPGVSDLGGLAAFAIDLLAEYERKKAERRREFDDTRRKRAVDPACFDQVLEVRPNGTQIIERVCPQK